METIGIFLEGERHRTMAISSRFAFAFYLIGTTILQHHSLDAQLESQRWVPVVVYYRRNQYSRLYTIFIRIYTIV
jgi:hypothetical protein